MFRQACQHGNDPVIEKPRALATQIVVDLVQCVPQLAGRHACRALSALALEHMHDLADAVESDPSVLGLTVPDPPVQPFDLRDDRRLRPEMLSGC